MEAKAIEPYLYNNLNWGYLNQIFFNQIVIKESLLKSEAEMPKVFCECSKIRLIRNVLNDYSKEYLEELMINVYFQLVIDQAVYYILTDARLNPNCLNEPETYNNFYALFPFLKIYNHSGPGYVSPVSFLDLKNYECEIFLLDKKDLLFKQKKIFWDNTVKKYFSYKDREDIINLCEAEFIRDLTLRHRYSEEEEQKLKFLFKVTNE